MANPHRIQLDYQPSSEGLALIQAYDRRRDDAEQERRRSLEQEAKSIAEEAQAAIGEAYQSPFTRETALHAARIALGLTQTTQEGEA